MRSRRVGAAVFGIAACLLSAGCAPEPEPEPEPEPLTVSAAGERYLEAICPVNAAWDAVDLEVDRVRIGVARGETVDLVFLHQALDTVAARSLAAERLLDDAEVAWPGAAAAPIAAVRETLLGDAERVEAVERLGPDEIPGYRWEGTEGQARASAEARAALELPDDPERACAERS